VMRDESTRGLVVRLGSSGSWLEGVDSFRPSFGCGGLPSDEFGSRMGGQAVWLSNGQISACGDFGTRRPIGNN
jgi:hypothetical protein